MTDQIISCPKCGTQIELSEALTSQIEQAIQAKYQAEAQQKEKEIQEKFKSLQQQAKELEKRQQTIDNQIAEGIKAEKKKIVEQERQKILAEQAEETKALKEELEGKRKEISEAKKKEIDYLKKQRELEEKAENIELEVQKQIAEERKKIIEDAKTKASEEQLLKIHEKDDKIEALTKQINDLKRRAEQGSQEAQGEALEGALQELLQQTFPFDRFEEVKKGQRGADILQVVCNNSGKECGKILWESKYTKDFHKSWIAKLKKDQQEASAEIAVVTTTALPKEIKNFGFYENVWITNFISVVGLTTALRLGLVNAAHQKVLTANQDTLKDVIYKYVTGQEFAMQIRAIADAFIRMKNNLDKEKRAMERIWKSREKQIDTVLSNISGIRGSLEGYIGPKALPDIEALSLNTITLDEE